MTSREQLHRVIEALPDREVTAALRFAEYLRDSAGGDSVTAFLLNVEEDPEELTVEEARRLDQALGEYREGRTAPWEQVKANLG